MEELKPFSNCISTQCPKYENCVRSKTKREDNIKYWYYCKSDYRFFIAKEKINEESKTGDNSPKGLEYAEGENDSAGSSRVDGSNS